MNYQARISIEKQSNYDQAYSENDYEASEIAVPSPFESFAIGLVNGNSSESDQVD
jgi:hypothetical protein